MAELPSGTVTFLFTDIEGSTRLWEEHSDGMHDALARHDAILRGAIAARGDPDARSRSPYPGPMLPETDVARVRRWVDARNERLPERARGQIRYELDATDRHVTVLECRPPWRPEYGPDWTRFPIVRFHYANARREWSTYWRDRNLRFHRFDLIPPSDRLEDLLAAVDADSTGIFWG